jgi:tRNA1(Val) A37 N6-methylase TrmN6
MEHSTEILYNNTGVFCTPAHHFGSDALLLARFCEPKRGQTAADLCSGCGIVALEWHDRGHRGPCAAIELQPDGSELLRAALEAQNIDHIVPICADLRTFRAVDGPFQAGTLDVCACNPPYFTAGPQSPSEARATARHETTCTLEDVAACAFRLLKEGGKLALCHRPERLAEVLAVLRAYRLEPKRLAFVKNTADGAPWLFLVEAQKNRRTGLKLEPDVLISAGAALYGPQAEAR